MTIQQQYLKIVKEYTERFKKDPNVVGITLNGGFARGTGDIFSEIDINFYVKSLKKAKGFPPKIPGIETDIEINGVWFDIKVLELDRERKENWDMSKRWDFANCKILFEKNKAITSVKKKKATLSKKEKNKLSFEYRFMGHWCIALAETFVKRKNIKHSHMLINEALNSFIDYYFIPD